MVYDKLQLDRELYASAHLYFTFHWPVETNGPVSGLLTLHGTLAARPELTDSTVVATITF
jgi:hypothetical protein